jgi:hypothetical protein
MGPAEVVVHEVQRDRIDVILCLLGEGVGQAGEAAHSHAHGQVLPLDMRRADFGHVGLAEDRFLDRARAFGGAVFALVPLGAGRVAVLLDENGVVHIAGERVRDGLEISPVAVSRQLDAVDQTPCQIKHELARRRLRTVAHGIGDHQLAITIHRGPGPDVASVRRGCLRALDVALFRVAERPDFIGLHM